MLRAIVPPLAAGYAVFVSMVLIARRRPVPRPGRGPQGGAPASLAGVVGMTVGGYIVFLAIVLVFHVWLAREADALASAVWGGAFLSSLALGAGAISKVIARRMPRRG
ncbi:MAG: DUF6256 family protein [Actinomycetota bacterium]